MLDELTRMHLNVDGYDVLSILIEELMSGDFVKVKVTGAMEYDLIGEI